jgi:hypothetical protein
VPLPLGELGKVLDYARFMNVDYLVVDERYAAPSRPDLQSLLEKEGPPGLLAIYSQGAEPGKTLKIFDLKAIPH